MSTQREEGDNLAAGDQLPSTSSSGSPNPGQPPKKNPEDFIFGKMVGEGSFSSVYLAKDVKFGKEYAIKVCDKKHIIKEKKTESVRREKEIMTLLSANQNPTAPFFVHLYATFQDSSRLYFVMTFAYGGELLKQLNRKKKFGKKLSQFYSGEIVQALRHMHKLKIVHRDLKPENILLNEEGHILITDFGSGKILDNVPIIEELNNDKEKSVGRTRNNSFVGTAQYVSPEVLQGKYTSVGPASDLWALGCVLYQFLTGQTPFQAQGEYLMFRKILSLDYKLPEDLDEDSKDIITKLLKLQINDRLGALDSEYYTSIQSHPFFLGVEFDQLHSQRVPLLEDDAKSLTRIEIPSDYQPGFNPRVIAERFLYTTDEDLGWGENPQISSEESEESEANAPSNEDEINTTTQLMNTINIDVQNECNSIGTPPRPSSDTKGKIALPQNAQERSSRLEEQTKQNLWHSKVKGNLILKQGLVSKRKKFFSRRRILLLTEGPHLYYCDPNSMELKGEIPWSPKMKTEAKDFKTFYIHTPNRTYYLEDPEGFALAWCEAINTVIQHTYGDKP